MPDSNVRDPENGPPSPLSVTMWPVFTLLKAVGFYAHDPVLVPKAYEPPLATFYVALLITVNIFLVAFGISAVERSVLDEGLWRVPTTCLVISAIRPIHCAFNLGLFRRGHLAHQHFWQQMSQIDHFFISRLQVVANSARLKATFILSSTAILVLPACISASQAAFSPNMTSQNLGDCLILVVAPVQCLWQLLPLVYYAHVGWLGLFWYRALHRQVDSDWEEFGRRRRRPLEFYSRQYTKLTEAVFAAGQFFHPIIFFSLAQSIFVLCLGVYFLKNAGAFFEEGTNRETGHVSKKAFEMAWTTLQILIAFAYVLILCFMRWQLKLRACMLAANILSYNKRSSRDYSAMRDTSSSLNDRRRQWRRRYRSECQHERHQSVPVNTVIVQSRQRFRRLTILASPRPILPSVWAASMYRRRETRGSTYL